MAAHDVQEPLSLSKTPEAEEKNVRTATEDETSGAMPRKSFQPYHAQSVPKSEDLEATAFERQSSGEPTEVTTMMLRNIPNKYTQNSLLQEIKDLGFAGTFDFFYLPMDVHNRSNVGYAFINFLKPSDAELFRQKFSDHRFQRFQSRKISSVCSAHVQGLYENLRHFENRAVTHARNDQYRPVVLRHGVRVDIEEVLADRKTRASSSMSSELTRSGDDWSRTSSWCSSDRTSSKDGQEGVAGSTGLACTKGNGKGGRNQKSSGVHANMAGPANKSVAGTASTPKHRPQQSPIQQAASTPTTREDLETALQELLHSQLPAKSQQLPSAAPPGLAGGVASAQQGEAAAAAAALMASQTGVQGRDIMQLLSLRSLILGRLPKDGVNQMQAYHQAAALLAMQQQQQQLQQLQQEYQMHLQTMPTLNPLSSAFNASSSTNWEEPAYIELSSSLYGGKSSVEAVGPAVRSNQHGDAWGMF